MKQIILSISLIGCASIAAAQDCPAAPDHRVKLAQLIAQAQTAPDEFIGRAVSNEMWALWSQAPDAAAQEVLDRGMTKRASYDYLGAKEEFDRLIEYCPEYAEGYNQRAFVLFLREEFEPALEDLEKVIEINPEHVAALAGRALTLMALGRLEEGQEALRIALKLNPWLPERRMLLPPKGEKL